MTKLLNLKTKIPLRTFAFAIYWSKTTKCKLLADSFYGFTIPKSCFITAYQCILITMLEISCWKRFTMNILSLNSLVAHIMPSYVTSLREYSQIARFSMVSNNGTRKYICPDDVKEEPYRTSNTWLVYTLHPKYFY